jgi:uncharacterized cysteine cluster protein YcgN (CxxCxxCC family)
MIKTFKCVECGHDCCTLTVANIGEVFLPECCAYEKINTYWKEVENAKT